MAKHKGLWLALGGGSRAERIKTHIEEDDTFTEVLSVSEDVPRAAEVVLVSLGGKTADYLGISEKGRRVATDLVTIRVSNLFALGNLPLSALAERLPRRQANATDLPHHGVARVNPRAWEELLKAVAEACPGAHDALGSLVALAGSVRGRGPKSDGGVVALERDAIGCALQAWSGPKLRKRVLRSARPQRKNVVPFIAQLANPVVREDIQVVHDQGVFPGFDVVERHKVGAVEFENSNGETLIIVNANRQPLESTLGVDLIYYTHRFQAFTLVQYKRMTVRGGDFPVYYSAGDRNFGREMERMAETEAALSIGAGVLPDRGLDEFRLSERPFFFKFCEATAPGPLDPSMIHGMYVPVDLLRGMLQKSNEAGRKGLAVRWHTCPRRFSNTEFTALLRAGWIGTTGASSEILSKLIEDILESGRMVVYAAASFREGREFLRDDQGQFAADDDPLASY